MRKSLYPFTKKLKIPPKRIKLKNEFDTPQLIYFVFRKEKGVPVDFYVFFSEDESKTDILVNLIIDNLKVCRKLKDEKYLGKAYVSGQYLIIDYTYLNYIR
jgi:hypothetical protein